MIKNNLNNLKHDSYDKYFFHTSSPAYHRLGRRVICSNPSSLTLDFEIIVSCTVLVGGLLDTCNVRTHDMSGSVEKTRSSGISFVVALSKTLQLFPIRTANIT